MIVTKEVHAEPIPGYRLIERLGSGGFGEVWKCEAPGGLFKAIKFVFGNLNGLDGDSAKAEEELRAIERVKAIRHPFLLSMERVECIEGELVIVMELADRNLQDLLTQRRRAKEAGIPRPELLGYLRDAAEVLDLMNQQHHLQHLDIKPPNLFLVSNHVKVGDFGLVNRLPRGVGTAGNLKLGAITPVYASPELFLGRPSRFSDQYSLAIVYQELLSGRLPFQGKNSRQLLFQHTKAEPDLRGLSPRDQKVLARALAKKPEDRFPSCLDLVVALETEGPRQSGARAASPPTMGDTVSLGRDTLQVPADALQAQENLNKIVAEIITALGGSPEQLALPPTLVKDEDVLRYKFRVGLPLGPARSKLELFCRQCYGMIVREDDRGCGFTVPMPRNFWSQGQPALAVQVTLDRLDPIAPTPIEVAAEVRALGYGKKHGGQMLQEMGLPLLDGLRAHLLINSEKRAENRLPWPHPLKVRTLYPDGKQGELIECRGKDISFIGIGFYLPHELDTFEMVIDFPSFTHAPAISVPATLVRAKRCPDGTFEVGALFRLSSAQMVPGTRKPK